MNLFNNALTELLVNKASKAMVDTFRIATNSKLKVKTQLYQQFFINEELQQQQNFTPVRNSTDRNMAEIQAMVDKALTETLKANNIEYTEARVGVAEGRDTTNLYDFRNAAELAVCEILVKNGEEIVCWHRTIDVIVEYNADVSHLPKLEWDRVNFPSPANVSPSEPVMLLNHADLLLISNGNESIEDFAKEAIDAGWKSVSIHGTQLLLIK